jgi:PKD repeat protein
MHGSRLLWRTAAYTAVLVVLSGCVPADAPTGATSRAPGVVRRDVSQASDPVIVAAGDIVCGNNTPAGTPCKHAQTAALIGATNPDAVLLLGDNQYEDGTFAEYNALYDPTWGAYKSITHPVPGNHEYQTSNASGYYDYFNGVGVQVGRAGDRTKGYYSYDLGAWHVVALNSNCGSVGGCGPGSAQEVWLRADLAAHPTACTLAYWHHPLFSSGAHGNDASTVALWKALGDYDADLVLTGHDHDYERFAPQTSTGALDNVHGVRSFVVGTGGKEQRAMGTTRANSQLRSNSSLGVLKVTLHPTSFDWQFVPVPGSTLNDAGSQACVVAASNQPPTAAITAPANGASVTQGTAVSFAGTGSDPETGALSGASLVWTSNLDGQIGTGASFSKSTLSVGTHTITLTAKDAQGAAGSATRTLIVTAPSGNTAPVARFTATCPAQQCSFDASTSSDDVGIVSYAWAWGNGRTETKLVPVTKNTFVTPGTYTITLTVTDGGGLTHSVTQAVPVPTPGTPPPNQAPTAAITAPAVGTSVVQGTSVSFAGTGSDPEQGALTGASLVWTSSLDGAIGTGTSFATTTLSVGTHTLTLTAKDAQGLTGTATRTLTVTPIPAGNQAPVARFTANCATGLAHQCALDASTSTDDVGIVSYAWSWGNGRSETKLVPTTKNTWATAPGTFSVTLTVTDAGGLTSTAVKSITVP